MDYAVAVEVFQSGNNLLEVALDLEFGEALATFKKLVKRLVGAKFEQNVYVFLVFEHMLEVYNVLVMKRFVDLDFGNKFLPCSRFGKGGLRDDLRGLNALCFEVSSLVAFRETSLSKEFSTRIALYSEISVNFGNFFLDDDWLVTVLFLFGMVFGRFH